MSNEHVNTTVRSILDTICPPAGATTGATMGEPVKPPAPVTVEVSDDQNTVTVTTRLEFVEETKFRCMNCAGDNNDKLCDELPCGPRLRKDGRRGYFREVCG
jgi:hypothetical protein